MRWRGLASGRPTHEIVGLGGDAMVVEPDGLGGLSEVLEWKAPRGASGAVDGRSGAVCNPSDICHCIESVGSCTSAFTAQCSVACTVDPPTVGCP